MSKKILITGSGGFVGKNLYSILKPDFEICGIDIVKNEFVDKVIDVSDRAALKNILDGFQPDVIVHLAALSNVEKCEMEKELADKCNVLPTKILAAWSAHHDKKIIYISSDYVYDGKKGGYDENDAVNPAQYYGETKVEGEKIVSALKNYIIFRPTVIYGWDPDGMNFFMQLYRNMKDGKAMRIMTDQISNPTFVLDLCRLIKKAIASDVVGKFVATGNEIFGRYDFAVKICDYFGWDKNLLVPVGTKSLGQIAKRPMNCSTINKLAVEKFDFNFNNLEHNLAIIRGQMV
ncbi:MAG: SDR family oxidoreductase [Patescibacteria group bacterium]|nr:SDR family oxidoreductase [Patescibacteria group bacterium]